MAVLTAQNISSNLKTKVFGKKVYFFEEVGSTNEVAFELARNGAVHGTIVLAETQTKGRGRMGRRWVSPSGANIYLSLVLRPNIEAKAAPLITFIASIALTDAAKTVGVEAGIKWPNDLLVNGKKLAGVLTELESDGDKVKYAVMGIGVNLNLTREMLDRELGDIAADATSVREALGREVDRVDFTANLINELERRYEEYLVLGFKHVIKEWNERCSMMGKKVEVIAEGKSLIGTAQSVDSMGRLLIRRKDGVVERVIAGDIVLV